MLGPKGLKRCWMIISRYTSNLIMKGGVVVSLVVWDKSGDDDDLDDYPGPFGVE